MTPGAGPWRPQPRPARASPQCERQRQRRSRRACRRCGMAELRKRHTPLERRRILAELADLADGQGGVVSRRQAYAAGLTRGEVRAQVKARRWQRVWTRSICLHTGEVSPVGRRWAAVFEGGKRAMLDGEASLVASGLEHYTVSVHRVSVPRGVKPLQGRGLDIRRTRRWSTKDLAGAGVPRTRVPVAAVRAAMWAASDRQASPPADHAGAAGPDHRGARRPCLAGCPTRPTEGAHACGRERSDRRRPVAR